MVKIKIKEFSADCDCWVKNSFFTLLADAIECAYLANAKEISNPGSKARFIRFSILSSALAIECAANACFQSLAFSSELTERMERHLRTLDKFEMASIALYGENRFDRGELRTQQIQDLIQLRNDYVHPKIHTQPVVSKNDDIKEVTVLCGQYQFLKLDKSFRAWKDTDPQTVLQAVDSFLTYFFMDHCQWTPERATEILLPRLVLDGKPLPQNPHHELDYIQKAEEMWKITFPFIHRPALTIKDT